MDASAGVAAGAAEEGTRPASLPHRYGKTAAAAENSASRGPVFKRGEINGFWTWSRGLWRRRNGWSPV